MLPKALITGATGFIGSHLLETLVEKKWDITCLVRPQSQTGEIEKMPVRILRGPMDSQDVLESAVEDQDYIFHLAARIRPAPPEIYDKANYRLTRNLANACLRKNPGVYRFVYVSSISVGGPTSLGQYLDETRPPNPASEYGRTKLKGEQALKEIWDKLPATIIRPPNVYGARQQETEILVKLIRKRIVPLLKEEGKTTSLIYIKDLIRGILLAAESSEARSHTYYLTDGEGYSWREIILTLKKTVLGNSFYLPIPENLIYSLAWFADILRAAGWRKLYFGRQVWNAMVKTRWLFSSSRAEKELSFRPHYKIDAGFKDMLNPCD
ncbi:MAG: NAD-dependent epimerase/dehydratase family protein [Candidatus Aminicenantes bacterium]|nr:MAG: NAD-dependent epimerase/dehydratase family protein [Candidatus Aminicenantes bacterium]